MRRRREERRRRGRGGGGRRVVIVEERYDAEERPTSSDATTLETTDKPTLETTDAARQRKERRATLSKATLSTLSKERRATGLETSEERGARSKAAMRQLGALLAIRGPRSEVPSAAHLLLQQRGARRFEQRASSEQL
jgi:hypothetical protein